MDGKRAVGAVRLFTAFAPSDAACAGQAHPRAWCPSGSDRRLRRPNSCASEAVGASLQSPLQRAWPTRTSEE